MKNFIHFILAVLVLGLGGFFAYRMYYQGESPKVIVEKLSEKKPLNVHYNKGKQAYKKEDYKTALKELTAALKAHDSGDRDNQLTDEDQREEVMFSIGVCYRELWEEGGKQDTSLQADGIRIMNRIIEDYPDDRYTRRRAGRISRELRSEKLESEQPENVSETQPGS